MRGYAPTRKRETIKYKEDIFVPNCEYCLILCLNPKDHGRLRCQNTTIGIRRDLALTGSAIGSRLRNSQRSGFDQLWRRVSSNDPDVRMGLPPRCDRVWFINTFCGGDDDSSCSCEDSLWDLVRGFYRMIRLHYWQQY